jgi:uncharacterized membrane protein
MKQLAQHLRARPRLVAAMAAGAAVGLALPLFTTTVPHAVTRALIGWTVAVWLYLLTVALMMWRADHGHLKRVAVAQAEGAATVLTFAVLAVVASLIGIVVELSAAKQPGAAHALPHLLFALSTVAGSWLLLPTLFALTYASLYHLHSPQPALRFPGDDDGFEPDYLDFLYFSFTIAVASQTADVSVAARSMRRLVLLQSLLSFGFNTAVLAFSINIAASMF